MISLFIDTTDTDFTTCIEQKMEIMKKYIQ